MNIIGALVAAALVLCGKRPKAYGWNLCFEISANFGLSLGIFILCPRNCSEETKYHEHGHSIQNAYFGPLFIFAVAIPSAMRFWIRRIIQKCGRPPTTHYDDIWFEGQATKSGFDFIRPIG